MEEFLELKSPQHVERILLMLNTGRNTARDYYDIKSKKVIIEKVMRDHTSEEAAFMSPTLLQTRKKMVEGRKVDKG